MSSQQLSIFSSSSGAPVTANMATQLEQFKSEDLNTFIQRLNKTPDAEYKFGDTEYGKYIEGIANGTGLNDLLREQNRLEKAVNQPQEYFNERQKQMKDLIALAKVRAGTEAYYLERQGLPSHIIRNEVTQSLSDFVKRGSDALNYNYPLSYTERAIDKLKLRGMAGTLGGGGGGGSSSAGGATPAGNPSSSTTPPTTSN